MPPKPNEGGWKDTVIMRPWQVTRIVARYAPTDRQRPRRRACSTILDPAAAVNNGLHCHIITLRTTR
jgi:hypothetical protein